MVSAEAINYPFLILHLFDDFTYLQGSLLHLSGYQRNTAEEPASSRSSPPLFAFLPCCLLQLPEHQIEMDPALQMRTFHAFAMQLTLILAVKFLLDLSKRTLL